MVDKKKEAIRFILDEIQNGERNLDRLKRRASVRFGLPNVIKNPDILGAVPKNELTKELHSLLLKHPVKTSSGVTPVALMIEPDESCKYGCIYCPAIGLAAKSYTGFEPAALRARENGFDPFMQTKSRIEQIEGAGHPAEKCEIIVMGGTFLEKPVSYKHRFIKGIYDALNQKQKTAGAKDPKARARSLESAIMTNEKAKHRAIGLTIETRPDVCVPYIDEMLSYGATRVELGVQHANDRIYKLINRGHKVSDVVNATKALKDSAFKVLYHTMPGLPGSNHKKDVAFAKKLFSDERFRPDMLKIYPTLVIGGTILERWMDEDKYEPYTSEEAADVISEFYRHIPKYVRVMRIQRDIPAGKIERGVKKSNLRELVEAKLRKKGIEPREIRYREVGLQGTNLGIQNNKIRNSKHKTSKLKPSEFKLERFNYRASGGKEIFLSFENEENHIAGFTRLRIPSEREIRKEIDPSSSALIRELHVYGLEVPIGLEADSRTQHKGLGSRLLEEAERLTKDEFGRDELVIISGVGVREYYRKRGYVRKGPYMAKEL